jgi:hypothetical protein
VGNICLLWARLNPWDEVNCKSRVVAIQHVKNFTKLEYHLMIRDLKGFAVGVGNADRNFHIVSL